jgi:Cys-rich repeat protein
MFRPLSTRQSPYLVGGILGLCAMTVMVAALAFCGKPREPSARVPAESGGSGARTAAEEAASRSWFSSLRRDAEAIQRSSEAGAETPPVANCTQTGSGFDCGCTSDAECPSGLSCGFDNEARRMACMKSECAADADCAEGKVCRRVSPGGTGKAVRKCFPPDVEARETAASSSPTSRTEAVAQGSSA